MTGGRLAAWCVIVGGLLGCAPGDPCAGPAPTIETCQLGTVWADCGGTGSSPALGCRGEGCQWFAGGCVAEGFTAEPCATEQFGYAWGAAAWDATRERNLSVIVATPSSDARPTLTCTGTSDRTCRHQSGPLVIRATAGNGVVATTVGLVHRDLTDLDYSVEVMTSASGAAGARVCTVPTTDLRGPGCVPAGSGYGVCAVSGTVTLAAIPTTDTESISTTMDVSAVFPDGSTLELRL